MDEKVVIKASRDSNLLKAVKNYMNSEKIDYIVQEDLSKHEPDVKKIVYIDDDGREFNEAFGKKNLSLIMISDRKRIVNTKLNINYIFTNLVFDETKYTEVQREYLYKKGIYHIFLEKLGELLGNPNDYNGMIYDLTELKSIPNNWTFSFESITDTYNWLLKKNRSLSDNFVRKIINFYDDKVYDDSLREINYLTDKLVEIKDGRNVIDIFICNKSELELFKKNYFFKLLVKNISKTYKFYLIDKDELLKNDNELMTKLKDGIVIYDDCIYRDTYEDEISLGYVDCNTKTIEEYNKYFDYIIDKYGVEIKAESDLSEF